jgi:hypothetical protein
MDVEIVRVKVLPDGRVPRADAARFLGLASATMAAWCVKGIGPRPRKVGGRIFYYLRDLEAFRDTGARQAD